MELMQAVFFAELKEPRHDNAGKTECCDQKTVDEAGLWDEVEELDGTVTVFPLASEKSWCVAALSSGILVGYIAVAQVF